MKMVVPCEVFSRVVGYYSSTEAWNDGKLQEFYERKTFSIEEQGDQGIPAIQEQGRERGER